MTILASSGAPRPCQGAAAAANRFLRHRPSRLRSMQRRYESMKAMQASRQAKQQAGRQQAGRQDGRLRRLRSHYLPSGEHAGAGPHHPAFSGHTHTHAPHALTPTAHTDCLRMSRWTPRTPSPVQHRSYAHLEASTAVAAAPPRHVHCARARYGRGWLGGSWPGCRYLKSHRTSVATSRGAPGTCALAVCSCSCVLRRQSQTNV